MSEDFEVKEMARISINDWQTLQSRKEIQSIRKTIREEKAINWSILVELFLLTVGFCLDNIFVDAEANINSLWIILSIVAFAAPTVILLIGWSIHKKRTEDLKQIHDVHEMITMFDDELCYYVMTASSFYESRIEPSMAPVGGSVTPAATPQNTNAQLSTEELQKFYYIEASYYLNKSVNILCLMKNNIANLIAAPSTQGFSYGQKISFFRFENVILLMTEMYRNMKSVLDNQTTLASISTNNQGYIRRLNDFVGESNRVFGTSLPEV